MPNLELVQRATAALRESRTDPKITRKDQLKAALEDNGFSPDEIALFLRRMAHTAEKESDQLKAMDMAMKMLGHTIEEKQSQVPIIQINIQGEQSAVNAIFVPQV